MFTRSVFTLVTAFATIAAVELAAPQVASADADPSKSPAADDITLTRGAMSRLEKNLADKADWATDKKARETARTSIQMVEPGIVRIRKADPKWDLSAWDRTLAAAKARMAAADASLAKADGAAQVVHDAYAAYSSAISSRRDTIELLAELENKPADVQIDSEQIFGKTLPTIVAMQPVDELCKAKRLTSLPIPPDYVGTKPSAADGCRLAASSRELGKKYIEIQAIGAAKRKAEHYEKLIAIARSGDSIDVSVHEAMLDPEKPIAAMRAIYDSAGEALGVTTDPAWYEPIRAAATKYPSAIDEAAKISRWDAAAKQQDPAIKAALVSDHGKAGELGRGKVLKVGSFADWSVETDEWKRPVSRSRSAAALVKIDGEAFCRLYERSFDEHYVKGTWSRASGRGGASFRISSCK